MVSQPGIRSALALLVAASTLAIGVAGCGSGLPSVTPYEVKGKVLLADGSPLSTGLIFFVPKSEGAVNASGAIEADGSFTLKTIGGKDGAAPGEYSIRIEPVDTTPMKTSKKGKPALPFPYKYTDEAGSGLVAKVEAKSNQLDPFILK